MTANFKIEAFSKVDKIIPSDYSFDSFQNNLKMASFDRENGFYKRGMQFFVEAYINRFLLEIKDYSPTNYELQKMLVHGIGKNLKGKTIATFCSFGSGSPLMTANVQYLTQFIAEASYHMEDDLWIGENNVFYVFTDCIEIHPDVKRMFLTDFGIEKMINFIGLNEIKSKVDGDIEFWDFLRKEIEDGKRIFEMSNAGGEGFEFKGWQTDCANVISEAIKNSENNNIPLLAQYIAPTGSGKGDIMYELIYRDLIRNSGKNIVVLVNSPTIRLCFQNAKRFAKHLKRNKKCIVPRIACFNSSQYDNEDITETGGKYVECTTNPDYAADICQQEKGPVVFFSTYHSNESITNKIKIHIAYCDESHNIVMGKIENAAKQAVLNSDIPRKIFITATQALSGNPTGKAMDNEKLYGKVYFRLTPREAIDMASIVAVQLSHFVITDAEIRGFSIKYSQDREILENNGEFVAYIIKRAFDENVEFIKKYSYIPELNPSCMIVACSGFPQMQDAIDSKTMQNWQKEDDCPEILALTSNNGVFIDKAWHESSTYWKNEFEKRAKMSDEDRKKHGLPKGKILLYLEMLKEGWNVEGINSILPFRELGDISSSQTLGRGMRLHSFDRSRLKRNEIKPEDMFSGVFVKPCCLVIVPKFFFEKSENGSICKMGREVMEQGKSPYEMFTKDSTKGNGLQIHIGRQSQSSPVPENVVDYLMLEKMAFDLKESEEMIKIRNDEKAKIEKKIQEEIDEKNRENEEEENRLLGMKF